MAQLLTFMITYEGLEQKIWRKAQVSSLCRLDQLGYLVLAAFDTRACHLFAFEFAGRQYKLPDEEFEAEDGQNLCSVRLNQLKMKPGNCLRMIYDFGLEQVFQLQLVSEETMPRGQGRSFPRLLDGAGRGILDDVPAFELKQLVEQIDRSGRTNQPVYYDDDDDDEYRLPWDYRTFDLKVANMVLKTKIRRIEKGFREDPDEYDE